MSLWTPDGERPIQREPAPAPDPGTAEADVSPSFDDLSPEDQQRAAEMAAQLAEARKQIAETPAAVVVANHVMGLYELAAIHLGSQPAALSEAAVAIDAMGAVLEALPGRLGDNEAVLREALQQLRMAYVEVAKQASSDQSSADADEPAG